MNRILWWASPSAVLCAVLVAPAALYAAPADVSFTQSAGSVGCYDYVEIILKVDRPDASNPFTDVAVEGEFSQRGAEAVRVDGFCDAADGSAFRIRFMPTQPGDYRYSVTYRQGDYQASHTGQFKARNDKRRGLIRVDKEHPWHFVWEGTGKHYFWNSTTTYWLLGWRDDVVIRESLDRLARLGVNRIRVALNGRTRDGMRWKEPDVKPSEKFQFRLEPWLAARSDDIENPGYDVTRFNLAHFRRCERMLPHARRLGIQVSLIFHLDGRDPGVDPFGAAGMGGPDEQRYYRYVVARMAAFDNVMWDVTNEWHLFRNEAWVNKMGTLIKQWDPYDHVTSVHGHGQFPFRTSPWADFAMYQSWDEHGGYAFMLKNRREQEQAGRPMPQVNEEYGYEDHYPYPWGEGRKWPARVADNRRRLAWAMTMAGGYQTTGERANVPGCGGWITGRGDDSMVMLEGYKHLLEFFTALPWWRLCPDNDFFEARDRSLVDTKLTHVAYTRDSGGKAVLYVDGAAVAAGDVGGDVSKWDESFRLALGNELTEDRPWLGELYRIAVYARVLSAGEICWYAKAGRDEVPADPVVLYDFRQTTGAVIADASGVSEPLNLRIKDASAVQWLDGGGLRIVKPTLIASSDEARKIAEAVRKFQAVTIEAWIKPAHANQTGPARIVSFSKDTGNRNFTLGQKPGAYEVRFRTTVTSPNGEPSLSSPGGDDDMPAVVGLRSQNGDLAVLYFSGGGDARIRPGAPPAKLTAQWFNPRTGQRSAAQADDRGGFVAPDELDWTLLLSRP